MWKLARVWVGLDDVLSLLPVHGDHKAASLPAVPLGETLPIPDIPKGSCVPWLLKRPWNIPELFLAKPGVASCRCSCRASLPAGMHKDGETSAGCSVPGAPGAARGRWTLLPCVAATGTISDLWEVLSFFVRSLFLLLSPFWAALFCLNN